MPSRPETHGIPCTHQSHGSLPLSGSLFHHSALRQPSSVVRRRRVATRHAERRKQNSASHRHRIAQADDARPEAPMQPHQPSHVRRPPLVHHQRRAHHQRDIRPNGPRQNHHYNRKRRHPTHASRRTERGSQKEHIRLARGNQVRTQPTRRIQQ